MHSHSSAPGRWVRSLIGSLFASTLIIVAQAHAAGSVTISQVYGGGGNSGATLQNDFVELLNRTAAPVDVSGWCLQYASAAGNFVLSGSQTVNLAGVIPANAYHLIQLAAGTGGTQPLPAPDTTGPIAMSATAGKLVLLNSCATAFDAGESIAGGRVVDFVGFGSAASRFEGVGPTANLSNATAALRATAGCTDGDSNSVDFIVGAPDPRNGASRGACNVSVSAPVVAACPATLGITVGAGSSAALSASDADGIVVAATIVNSIPAGIALDALVPAATPGGAASVNLTATSTLAPGTYPVLVAFANADTPPQTTSCSINVVVSAAAVPARIHDVQGAAHLSPLEGKRVAQVPGIVTAVRSNGFWFQDPQPDNDVATSEGLFVFTSTPPIVVTGDALLVTGTVTEFRPGGSSGTDNLTTTEIITPTIAVVSSGNALPAPVIVGSGGRLPPQSVIDNDAVGSVETTGTFDATADGIDFYESLEGMRVQLNNVVATGPTSSTGEIFVIADGGANATGTTPRGGIAVSAGDFNPERLLLDNALAVMPQVNVGDRLASVVGVIDYSFANFVLLPASSPLFISAGLQPETTALAGTAEQLTVASFNVENLAPGNPPAKFAALAQQLITNLRAPDIVGLMEIQDANGATNDGTVSAAATFDTLIAAIVAAGGPTYAFRQIDPVNNSDGGEPGGNIRVGFLFNAARVSFVDRTGGSSTTATTIVTGTQGPELSASPGRIDPANAAFASSRKPLVGEFVFNGHRLFVIANHFNSKGGDQPLYGRFQPPTLSSEVQRKRQAVVVADFVTSLLTADSDAKVIVLGDLNDFQFSPPLDTLRAAGLNDLVDTLPAGERYTYVFEGNSQALDHILVSDSLLSRAAPIYDVVHTNSEFADQISDHDPEVVRLTLPLPQAAVDVTNRLLILPALPLYRRATNTFEGSIYLRNISSQPIAGPVQVRLESLLPRTSSLINASGTNAGAPVVTMTIASLAPGKSLLVPVRFASATRLPIPPLFYRVRVFSGVLALE